MLYCMAPLPVLLLAFKLYCKRSFDRRFKYYSVLSADQESARTAGEAKQEKKMRKTIDRVGVKFGQPALYQPLMRPMVHAKAQHLLKDVLRGQLDTDGQSTGLDGTTDNMRGRQQYSDIYMSQMSETQTGKLTTAPSDAAAPAFEIVKEGDLDFEHFKRRAEFRHEFGGDGELYGVPDDDASTVAPSNASIMSMSTLATENNHISRGRRLQSPSGAASTHRDVSSGSRETSRSRIGKSGLFDATETTYRPGYAGIEESPERGAGIEQTTGDIADDRGALLRHAAAMGRESAQAQRHLLGGGEPFLDIGASGYSSVAGTLGATPMLDEEEETSYDYFRRGGGRGRVA